MRIINLFLTFAFLQCLPLLAQVDSYSTQQLPAPNQLSPFFLGSVSESAIYYGDASQANPNKPVVVFVHGFIDLANLWFAPGNSMYKKFHDRGHRTVFVAMSRGEGMWYNGEMLSYMLDDITAHYGVNDVVIVAHSNGGKASEVAMFQHGKYQKVNRVLALGTPFRGTGLADIAELQGLSWIVNLIGLGGGTSTSTTYYMEQVARPILDALPNNQAQKFVNFGAWGYANGGTILAPTMYAGGNILNLMGAGPWNGGNDGVTPYYSSSRPGGTQMWPGHCWGWWCNQISKHDHIDLTMAWATFNDFYPYISGPLPLRVDTPQAAAVVEDARPYLESEYQMLFPGQNSFTIPAGVGEVSLSILAEEEDFTPVLQHPDLGDIALQGRKYLSPTGAYTLGVLPSGTYHLDGLPSQSLVFVHYEGGVRLVLDKEALAAAAPMVRVQVVDRADIGAKIKATLRRTADIWGNPVPGDAIEVDLTALPDGWFEYQIPEDWTAGVYSLALAAQGKDWARSLVSGFALKKAFADMGSPQALLVEAHPNPAREHFGVHFSKVSESGASMRLYDAMGRLVESRDYALWPVGLHHDEWQVGKLPAGTYLLEYTHNGQQKTQRVMIVR